MVTTSVQCSHLAVGLLVQPHSVDDTPDPWDNGPCEEELNEPEAESHSVEFLSSAGTDECAQSGEEDVKDEANESHGWVKLHDGVLAAALAI